MIHAWLPVYFLVPCGDAIACAEQTHGRMKQHRSFICLDTGQGGETERLGWPWTYNEAHVLSPWARGEPHSTERQHPHGTPASPTEMDSSTSLTVGNTLIMSSLT